MGRRPLLLPLAIVRRMRGLRLLRAGGRHSRRSLFVFCFLLCLTIPLRSNSLISACPPSFRRFPPLSDSFSTHSCTPNQNRNMDFYISIWARYIISIGWYFAIPFSPSSYQETFFASASFSSLFFFFPTYPT